MIETTKGPHRYTNTNDHDWSGGRSMAFLRYLALATALSVLIGWFAPDLLGANRSTFTISASYGGAPTAAVSLASSR
jgi:hypothetical protein